MHQFVHDDVVQQVKRNITRFPDDLLLRLTADETAGLNRSQRATGTQRHRDRRFPPYAFTEHGALMAPPESGQRGIGFLAEIE